MGVPYANAPARWSYPQPYTGSISIDATKFGAPCVQAGLNGSSENCLFLNIWTPYLPQIGVPKKSSLKPVMLWIHGGAFTSGMGSDPTFDGGNMASRGDVVLVTINYRLSTLGFLALADGKTKGNYGIADQIAALEWVGEHISAFGGDPSRITIFGQSAGAGSVRTLLGSPKAIGKFAAAVPMSNLAGSGYATSYSTYYTIAQEVEDAAQLIMQETGCKGSTALQCLKKYDAQALVSLPDVARFVPKSVSDGFWRSNRIILPRYVVVDGTYVTADGLQLTKNSKVANVHAMMGFMRDDGAAFISAPVSIYAQVCPEARGTYRLSRRATT